MSENGPEKKFIAGSVSATVWLNSIMKNGSSIQLRTISLQKSYKDKDGQWKNAQSLHVNDIPKAKLVLDKAYEYLAMHNEVSA